MSIAGQLQQLHQLHVSGALSDEEFATAKQAVLKGMSGEATKATSEGSSSLGAHLMQKGTPPSSQPPLPSGAPPPKSARAFAYGPVTPKLAKLDPEEQHLHTFRITPYVYKNASLFPPRIGGWYPDGTLFLWHLSNRRFLIEPYKIGKTEGAAMKYLLALGKLDLVRKIGGMATNQDWESGQDQLRKMGLFSGNWYGSDFSELLAQLLGPGPEGNAKETPEDPNADKFSAFKRAQQRTTPSKLKRTPP